MRLRYARGARRAARGGSGSGFTLIELLVVIGVIGILAGLLLPAINKAKERGRAIKCLSNAKQMGLAIILYAEDNSDYYPPGRVAGYTQWDLAIGRYAGGHSDPLTPEARSALFMCPSVKTRNDGIRLNYSANPNVFKEIVENVGQVPTVELKRPVDTVLVADAIQYTPDGNSHAILWGVQGSAGAYIYWNDGSADRADLPIKAGTDKDQEYDPMDPNGSNFRFRHDERVTALFADGHAEKIAKGKVRDRHVYTNY